MSGTDLDKKAVSVASVMIEAGKNKQSEARKNPSGPSKVTFQIKDKVC